MDNKSKPKKPRRAYTRKRVTIVGDVSQNVGVQGMQGPENAEAIVTPTGLANPSNDQNVESQNVGAPVENKPQVIRKAFTEPEEEIIISFYCKNRFLWDCTDPNYKVAVKSASLQELVRQLGSKYTAQELHHRFSGMRTTYKNNLAKIKKSQSTGAAAEDVYVPTWPHFENMKFLDDSTPNRTSFCSYTIQELNNETVDLTQNSAAFESEISNAANPRLADVNVPSPKPTKTLPSSIKSKNAGKSKDHQAEIMDECLEVLRSVKDIGNPTPTPTESLKDRCNCYGQYVTASLKEMNLWNQTLAMADITNVLMKYDPNNPEK